ncbi:hypothetical protein JAAARDRAFT_187497 [Jaapia argillacea MUCL 33604]|uniref:EVE domain-containing protein n=1 Tax=Jaapia argillacea MUCL 33604 TaxID=933084 RepID=A0A067QAY8_9AGAM|nr:hypothetical protein JAAARDRAFT_187497 [Jaapia argillacea MUCL 33604]
MSIASQKYWLMKAEPESRVVKGKDVKFSVDDFESVGTTAWEGVRNHEAKNLMKQMKIGDQVLFYHSSCKTPGVAAFAEVSKEAYPDHSAWDVEHPYYDSKTDQNNPRWYMVDVTFKRRAQNYVPLSLLKYIADSTSSDPLNDVPHIGPEGVKAIKAMALVTKGRLSVQKVEQDAWDAISLLAEKGGWDEKVYSKAKKRAATTKAKTSRSKKNVEEEEEEEQEEDEQVEEGAVKEENEPLPKKAPAKGRKRKLKDMKNDDEEGEDIEEPAPTRRSARTRAKK